MRTNFRIAPNTEQSFWANTDRSDPAACWEWHGALFTDGYGTIKFKGRQWRAHRLAYFLTHPAANQTLCVLHRCDNPPCCNPAHLFLGTKTDNAKDRQQKGRTSRLFGESHGLSKLKTESVLQMRKLYSDKIATQYELASAFGVSQSTVSDIIRRVAWPHI